MATPERGRRRDDEPMADSNLGAIEDRVVERARNRRRPLMPDDETVIRVLVEQFVKGLVERGEWPPRGGEDELVDVLVACIGGVEFEQGKEGGFSLRMVAPDEGMWPDA